MLSLLIVPSTWILAQEDEDSETYDLSPFMVETGTDEGYGATDTLAGTRLRTSVRDLGASISLITEEFMNDIAAQDLQELLPYTANTEVGGGMFGTFGREKSVNMFGQGFPTTLARQRPQGATRVRGLSEADLTRNYNLTDLPMDGYNVDRVAIQRGANAMLFGLGSPAGLINTQLITARTNEDATKIELRTDQYGTIRAALDHNQVLIEDQLAVRVAILHEEQEFVQEPTFEDDNRGFVTITWKPFENTTFRGNFEAAEIESNRPDYISPGNGISEQWFNAGMPVATQELYAEDHSAVFPLGTGNHLGNANRGIVNIWESPDAPTANTQFEGVAWVKRNAGNRFDNPGTEPGTGPWRFHSSGTYRGQNIGAGSNSNDPAGNHARSEEQGFLDLNTFNYEKIKLRARERVWEEWTSYDFSIEQLFLTDIDNQNAGFEFNYHKENYDDVIEDGQWDGISSWIFVDVNPYVGDGRTNPNFGRPFTYNLNPQQQTDRFRRDVSRLTAFYEVDFTDTDANWLGRHSFTALSSSQSNWAYHDEAPWNTTPATRDADEAASYIRNISHMGSFTAHPTTLTYIGPSVLNATSYDQIKITGHDSEQLYQEGQTYQWRVWDQENQEWVDLAGNLVGPGRPRKANVSQNDIDSLAAILHSRWLGDSLVTTLGWREDEVDLFSYITERDEFNLVKVGSTANLTPVGTQKEDIFSYGGVYHVPGNFFGDGNALSLHYSTSENFAPEAGRTDAAGIAHASPGGETEEYGFTFSFNDENITVRFNWYETSLVNASTSTPIGNNERIGEGMIYNRASSYLGAAEAQLDEGNTELAADMVEIAERIMAVAPASLASVYGFSRVDTYTINFSDPANSTQVADIASEGMEVELVGRLADNWNIGFNVAQQEVVQTNIAQKYIALWEQLTPQWQNLFDLPTSGGDYADWILNGDSDFNSFKDNWDTGEGLNEQVRRSEGLSNPEIREWRWNLFTNYTFTQGSGFAGWGVGGALRYQSDVTVGYQSDTFTNALGEAAYTADLNNPIKGPSLLQGDIWFSYRPQVFEKINWTLRLNVRNALRDDSLVPVKAQPDSPYTEYATMRVTLPTTFILTSTFEF